MPTISKFYLLDAASPVVGTLPSNSPAAITGLAVDGDATGASTARDATSVPGTSNPDIESLVTSTASINQQVWGHRRFVSRLLAAQSILDLGGNWTFSYARQENNVNHNMSIRCRVYVWRPTTGARVGAGLLTLTGSEPASASTETAESVTAQWAMTTALSNGDVLVFDVYTIFTQAMATAYTENFCYDGTTEASITTCASFVTPPSALTLYTPSLISDRSERRYNQHRRIAASRDRW